MARKLSINPRLPQNPLEVGGGNSEQETVNKALRENAALRERQRLLNLFGKLDWDDSYNHKAERSRM